MYISFQVQIQKSSYNYSDDGLAEANIEIHEELIDSIDVSYICNFLLRAAKTKYDEAQEKETKEKEE